MRRLVIILLCFAVFTGIYRSVFAREARIVDDAGLLTEKEVSALDERARELTEKYDVDVVIVTVQTLNGKNCEAYADDYYDENGYGIGSDYSGILLLFSMEYRDWAISTTGKAISVLSDSGIQSVFSAISPFLSENAYYLAFNSYMDALEAYFEAYNAGIPIEEFVNNSTEADATKGTTQIRLKQYTKRIGIAFLIGIVVALISLLIMRSKMNTVKHQIGAQSYIKSDTYSLEKQQDIFLYSQVRKVRRSENNSSSSGESSVHRSSSGRSHGGGHGKF